MRRVDVAVLGGGIAGLSLTRHLLRARPGLDVALIDARPLPCSRERRSIGESTSEVAGWYLSDRLDLREHLEQDQIPKFGLRFWVGGDAGDIATRLEFGPLDVVPGHESETPPLEPRTYQLHRGRLEHHLAGLCAAAGAQMLDCARGRALEPAGEGYTLTLARGEHVEQVRARWVIDASGEGTAGIGDRAPLRPVAHHLAALWWWPEVRIDPTQWSDSAELRGRGRVPLRWTSTQHLMGRGYWVWLIPLSDGSTSVGLVVDRTIHGECSDAAALRAFLCAREPQLVRVIGAPPPGAFFRTLDAGMRPPFVGERLAVTGAALGFLDALYSSGHDFTALANEAIVPRILADLDGRPLPTRPANELLAAIMRQYEEIYVDAYAMFDDPTVMAVKFAWDQLIYFGWVAVLARSGRFADGELTLQARPLADRVHRLNVRMQALLREWAVRRAPAGTPVRTCVDQSRLVTVMQRFIALRDTGDVPRRLREAVDLCEEFALATLMRACEDLDVPGPEEPLDPYGLTLDPSRWASEGLFNPRRGRRVGEAGRRDLSTLTRAP